MKHQSQVETKERYETPAIVKQESLQSVTGVNGSLGNSGGTIPE